ncbi:MAG: hypothetical protein HQL27_07355 [Candidatus Omnitrophica bacterium]|nr:hypothetical protein [Candidatus Omnitrophota bacterium]
MAYQNKLKKTLIEKMQRYYQVAENIRNITQKEHDYHKKLNYLLSKFISKPREEQIRLLKKMFPEKTEREINEMLLEASKEVPEETPTVIPSLVLFKSAYSEILEEYIKLNEEINGLMLDLKYYPIMGLWSGGIEMFYRQDDVSGVSISERKPSKRQVDDFLNMRMEMEREDIKRRLNKVSPLILDSFISTRTQHFYQQVLKCYVHGFLEASCVLCRAITETIAKEYISNQDCGELLDKKYKDRKKESIQEILIERLEVDKKIVSLYTKIGNKADNILHKKEQATDEETFEIINFLQEFIKKFPKHVG